MNKEPEFFGGVLNTWACYRPSRDVVDVFIVRYSKVAGGDDWRTEAFGPDGWTEYAPHAEIAPAISLAGCRLVDVAATHRWEDQVTKALQAAMGQAEVRV